VWQNCLYAVVEEPRRNCLYVEECCASDLAELSVCGQGLPVIWQNRLYVKECASSDLFELVVCEQCASDLAELPVCGGACQ
jgi:hypothetical protein